MANYFFVSLLLVALTTFACSQETTCPENEEWRECIKEPPQWILDCDMSCLGIIQSACLSEVCQQLFVEKKGDCRCKSGFVRKLMVGGPCVTQEDCNK